MALGLQLVRQVDDENPVEGDLQISRGRFVRLADRRASIAQACTVALRWWLGEWWLAPKKGIPYIRDLLGRTGISERGVGALLERELKKVAGVIGIARAVIVSDRATGLLSVSELEVNTIVGAVAVDGTFGGLP